MYDYKNQTVKFFHTCNFLSNTTSISPDFNLETRLRPFLNHTPQNPILHPIDKLFDGPIGDPLGESVNEIPNNTH
jgi:hypothetical protein